MAPKELDEQLNFLLELAQHSTGGEAKSIIADRVQKLPTNLTDKQKQDVDTIWQLLVMPGRDQSPTKAKAKTEGGGGDGGDEEGVTKPKEVLGTRLTFESSSFVGMNREIKELQKTVLLPQEWPQLFEQGGNVMLYGPPGGGKTYLVQALVSEVRKIMDVEKEDYDIDPSSKDFILKDGKTSSVTFYAPTAADIKSKFIGGTAKNLTAHFDAARDAAAKTGGKSILFLDEFESLAAPRAGTSSGADSVQTLLQMMDGANSEQYENVIVVAATNLPWGIDTAIASRFSTKIFVDVPGANARYKLIEAAINKRIKSDEDGQFRFCPVEEREQKQCQDMLNNLTKLSGFSTNGLDHMRTVAKNEGIEKQFTEFLTKGDHITNGGYNACGLSSRDLTGVVKRSLDTIAFNKLTRKYTDCYLVDLDFSNNKPLCAKQDIKTRKNTLKITPHDVVTCQDKFIETFKESGQAVDVGQYIEFVVYNLKGSYKAYSELLK